MDKRKIVRYLLITLSVILGVLVFLSITGTVAHAAGLVDNTVSDANAYPNIRWKTTSLISMWIQVGIGCRGTGWTVSAKVFSTDYMPSQTLSGR